MWLESEADWPKLSVSWKVGEERSEVSGNVVACGGLRTSACRELPWEPIPCVDCVARSGRSRDRDLLRQSLWVFGCFL